ncbi:hypothetical protein [Nocardioides sp. SYSU D00038]|nr:hypothetical protein [Nocardioides sp. SYSU D00038]
MVYILVALIVLIVLLVIANARRGGPEASRRNAQGDGGIGSGGGSA